MFVQRFLVLSVLLGAVSFGCKGQKTNPNESAFKRAASELPAAEARAQKIGLAYRPDDLIHHVPSSQNAAGHYEVAFAMLSKQPLWVEPIDKLDTGSLRGANTLLTKAAPMLAEVKKACALPHFYLPPGKGITPDFGKDERFKAIGKLLCLRARVKAHSGDYAGAGEDLGCVGQLMKHLMEYPSLIDWLVAYSIHTTAVQTAEQIVTEQSGNSRCAEALFQGMSRFPNRFSIAAVIPHETVMYMTLLAPPKGHENETGLGKGSDSMDADWNAMIAATNGINSQTILNAFRARHLQVYTSLYEIADDKSLSEKQQVDKMCAIADKARKSGPTYWQIGEFRQAWTSFVRYQAMQEVTLLGLQSLANPNRSGVPGNAKDPFTNGPLHFKRKPGGFVLYSVGPNLKDDGGNSKSPADDIAFQYPHLEHS